MELLLDYFLLCKETNEFYFNTQKSSMVVCQIKERNFFVAQVFGGAPMLSLFAESDKYLIEAFMRAHTH